MHLHMKSFEKSQNSGFFKIFRMCHMSAGSFLRSRPALSSPECLEYAHAHFRVKGFGPNRRTSVPALVFTLSRPEKIYWFWSKNRKNPIFLKICADFARNERGQYRSYDDVWGTELAQFFPEIPKTLSILRFEHFIGKIRMPLHMKIFEKSQNIDFSKFWGCATCPQDHFRALAPHWALQSA